MRTRLLQAYLIVMRSNLGVLARTLASQSGSPGTLRRDRAANDADSVVANTVRIAA